MFLTILDVYWYESQHILGRKLAAPHAQLVNVASCAIVHTTLHFIQHAHVSTHYTQVLASFVERNVHNQPDLLKWIHLQGYNMDYIPFLVRYVPSMYKLMDDGLEEVFAVASKYGLARHSGFIVKVCAQLVQHHRTAKGKVVTEQLLLPHAAKHMFVDDEYSNVDKVLRDAFQS
jgi:hypothetical protein